MWAGENKAGEACKMLWLDKQYDGPQHAKEIKHHKSEPINAAYYILNFPSSIAYAYYQEAILPHQTDKLVL